MRMGLSRFGAARQGVGAVEFALLLPVLLLAILGSFQMFRLARAKMLTVNAARNIADLVSQQDSVGTTKIADYCIAAQLSMQPIAVTPFAASVASVTYSGTARSVAWTDTTCGTVAAIANAGATAAPVTPSAGDSAIVVSATYAYTAPISFMSLTITLTATALARPRNGTAVSHS